MQNKTYKMILVSLFAALTAIGAFFKIPLPPVPFTLQIFFVILAGMILGSRLGFASQAIYVAIGLVGVPVFANGGGIEYVNNPTFGFLLGFALTAFIVGFITEKSSKPTMVTYTVASFIGVLAAYAVGIPYLYMILKFVLHVDKDFSTIIVKYFLLYLPWDIVKIIVASWVAKEVTRRVKVVAR